MTENCPVTIQIFDFYNLLSYLKKKIKLILEFDFETNTYVDACEAPT